MRLSSSDNMNVLYVYIREFIMVPVLGNIYHKLGIFLRKNILLNSFCGYIYISSELWSCLHYGKKRVILIFHLYNIIL